MRRQAIGVLIGIIVIFTLFLPAIESSDSMVLWKGAVCKGIVFQKSIESIAIEGDTIYVGCGYIENIKDILWYRGNITAFSINGTKLWTQDVGFVRKIAVTPYGIITGVDISRGLSYWFGTLGKVWLLQKNGSIATGNVTYGSFFDFQIVDDNLYISDGWWIGEGRANETWGRVYEWQISNEKFIQKWFVELNGTIGRVRVAKGIIYAGSGAPSGYKMKYYFGDVYGISPNGKVLWKRHLGWWVRDMEIWQNNVLVGTGFENIAGKIYLINPEGKILWSSDLYYVEDIEIHNNIAYISGIQGIEGKLTAIDLNSKKILWQVSFPYRAKVVEYYRGYLLVGTGKFEIENKNNQTMVYSIGELYVVDANNGKVITKINTGYVRSIAVHDDIAVVGTGSSEFYVLSLEKIESNNLLNQMIKISVPIVLVIAVVFAIYLRKKRSHGS
ncbi:outer membrane protein assembly factor BamB family protein [Thermococcus sp.]